MNALNRHILIPIKKATIAALRFVLPFGFGVVIKNILRTRSIPNLLRPNSFNEKILCKMLFDRNPALPVVADKLAVRDFVTSRLGAHLLPELYKIYNSETEIDLDDLPDKFVLKANHGSAFNCFVSNESERDIHTIKESAKKWLATDYSLKGGEWCYKPIQPKLFAEEYLDQGNTNFINYNFHCFGGKNKIIRIIIGQKKDFRLSRFYDQEWNAFDVVGGLPTFELGLIPRPKYLKEMIKIAETLSVGFDFMRVDLYQTDNKIFFGEMTNYPAAGVLKLKPPRYNNMFGSFWKLETMAYLPKTRTQLFRALMRISR